MRNVPFFLRRHIFLESQFNSFAQSYVQCAPLMGTPFGRPFGGIINWKRNRQATVPTDNSRPICHLRKGGKRGALLCIPWRPTEALYHHPLSPHSAMACFGRREGTFVCLSNQPSSRFTLFRLSGVHFPFLGSTTCYCQLVHCPVASFQ